MNSDVIQKKRTELMIIITITILAIILIVINQPIHTSASTAEDTYTYLPIIQNNFDSTVGIPLFGVQTYGSTRPDSQYYDALIDSKTRWVRVNASWISAEPTNSTPNDYTWAAIDASLDISTDSDINVIATIRENPDWAATSGNGIIDLVEFSEFAEFIGALVERYDGDGIDDAPDSPVVIYWEFYNEPDTTSNRANDPGWGDDPDVYANMLQAVYPAVKNANPAAQVVLGGIAYDFFYDQGGPFNPDFLDGVLQFGGDYFDIMNFHAYPVFSKTWTDLDGPGLLQKTEAVRDKLTLYGYGDRPIFITEAGWHSNDTSANGLPASPAIQSHYVIELFTQSLAADVDVMIWWMLFDPGGGYWDNGLVTNDNPPVIKPAFVAYQTAVSELSTAHFQRTWTAAETGSVDIEVYEFNDNVHQRTTYVAWINPVDTDVISTITIAGQQATTIKINGLDVVEKHYTGIAGSITIPVSAQPIFIEVDK